MEQTEYRLTRFPILSLSSPQEPSDQRSEFELTHIRASREVLLFAWATLLGLYTGEEAITFLVDDHVIRVNTTDQSSKTSEDVPLSDVQDERGTGIFFDGKARPFHLALELQCYPEKGTARLNAACTIPSEHLLQLSLQLSQIYHKLLKESGESEFEGLVSEPALSITNSDPQLLEGPQDLISLLRINSHSSTQAIDFLTGSGERTKLSYASLESLSLRFAASFRDQVIASTRPGGNQPTLVILLPQSPELYIAILAALKVGASFCPLGLDSPEERVKFILRDVSAAHCITNSTLRHRIPPDCGTSVILADSIWQDDKDTLASQFEAARVQSTDAAYVYYTSGSTGLPKGVVVSHLAVTQSLLAHDSIIPPFKRFLQFAAPTFDVFLFEMFFPLFRGSTIVGSSREQMLNHLVSTMNKLDVDAAELTPTVASSLLRTRKNVPGLKLLLTIGEMLSRQVIAEFGGSDLQESILYAMYGPTESAIHCTAQPLLKADARVGIIGQSLDPVSTFVIAPEPSNPSGNAEVEVVPVGQIGELALGGYQLATEYLNRPEQTKKAFIDTPAYGRLYRTGDKARLLPDGTLECLGRIASGQVKLRGQRIELGEIEQIISRISWCQTSIAAVIDGTLVVFCLVSSDSDNNSAKEIIDLCRRWLPTSMVPADVVILSSLPRLSSGKVDKRKLEADYLNKKPSCDSVLEEEDEVLRKICSIVQEVTGRKVTRSTKLATCGLDSLKSIKLASLLRKSGLVVGVTDILAAEDLLSVRKVMDTTVIEKSTDEPDAAADIKNIKEKLMSDITMNPLLPDLANVFLCTPMQSAMLAESTKNPQAYCNWVEIEFPRKLSYTTVKAFFEELARKNEILRSGFWLAERFVQLVWTGLTTNQFAEMTNFEREYQLESGEALLRPLKVQINSTGNKTRALLQLPHFLYDGWSMELILEDLSALSDGRPVADRAQFHDVSSYFEFLHPAVSDRSLQYWQEELKDYTPLPLPNYNGRHLKQDVQCRVVRRLSISLGQVGQTAYRAGVTGQALFQAALAYILSAYLGVPDVVYGVVTSGRTIPVSDIENIIGPCIVTLPLRVDLGQLRTAADLLRCIHDLNRALLHHCHVSLRDIKRACGFAPGNPIFDTLFVWQESLSGDVSNRESRVKELDAADYLEFKLVLEIQPFEDHFSARVTYMNSYLPDNQVKLLLDQLEQAVAVFVTSLDTPLSAVNGSLPDSALSIINPVPERFCSSRSLAFPVQTLAETRPEDIAVEFYSKITNTKIDVATLTYLELNNRANQVAQALLQRKLRDEELVCICMEKSLDLYVSILAAIKAGFGYLPITPETPKNRILNILEESKVRLCIGKSSSSFFLKNLDHLEFIDADDPGLLDLPTNDFDIPWKPHSPAYAVFTSGSSGKPKGVLVTRENLDSNLNVLAAIYPVTAGDKLLQACSQSFDVSVFEIFFAWSRGMVLCAAEKDDLFRDLEFAINTMDVTHLSLTPTVAALIDSSHIPKVKFLVTAGEPMTQNVLNDWADGRLYQGYGPSETTNICTLKPRVSADDLTNNIGPPFKNTSAFVMSESSSDLVLRGGLGELCFGGMQVAQGYMNMPQLTATKFINHSRFGRLYRSGDLGRILPDGAILFAGRLDDQIKVRGNRVELGEINSCVLQLPAARESYSTLVDISVSQHSQLVTFWVPKDKAESRIRILSPEACLTSMIKDIFLHLTSHLPSYMVPTLLVPVTSLPTTLQGKVDRKALSSLFMSLGPDSSKAFYNTELAEDDYSSWFETERVIAHSLAKIIAIDARDIGRHTSFFGLGLDSISAIGFSKTLGVNISTVLRHSTVASLARAMSDTSSRELSTQWKPEGVFATTWLSRVRVDFEKMGGSIKTVLPCTPLQEAMLSKSQSSSMSYHNRIQLRIHGDSRRLRACWQAMCRRHDILRTCFLTTENPRFAFAQAVLTDITFPWSCYETSDGNIDQLVAEISKKHPHGALDSFMVPYSFVQITSPTDEHLVFFCHHALYDDIAMKRMLKEVEETYHKRDLPPPIPYENYLVHLNTISENDAREFWSKCFDSFGPALLPSITETKHSHIEAGQQYGTLTKTVQVSLAAVEAGCRKAAVTMLSLGQATWAKVLSSYLGEDDVCFGSVLSGRQLPVNGLERLVAPCFNTLPIRISLAKHNKNRDLMRALRDINAQYLQFQLTPLRRIQSFCGLEGFPLFDTIFLMQQPSEELDAKIWSIEDDAGAMDIPILCEMRPEPRHDRLSVTLHFDRTVITGESADCLTAIYCETFLTCLHYPSAQSSDFGALPDSMLSSGTVDLGTMGDKLRPTRSLQNNSIIRHESQSSAEVMIISRETDAIVPILGVGELCMAPQPLHNKNSNQIQTDIAKRRVDKAGVTMYRTGILARMAADRSLRWAHYAADEVKLNGRKIYQDEIHPILKSAHESVTDVTTQVFQQPDSSRQILVALLSVDSSNVRKAAEIEAAARSHASKLLQQYQLPQRYFVLDHATFSDAANDPSMLRSMYDKSEVQKHHGSDSLDETPALVQAQSHIRKILATISDCNPSRIREHTTIYQLGIDSISAIQIAAQLTKENMVCSAADIMEHPTVKELTDHFLRMGNSVRKQQASFEFDRFDRYNRSNICKEHRIQDTAIESIRPCTPAQGGLLAQFISSRGSRYFSQQTFQLDLGITHSDIYRAWEAAFAHHRLLRAGFVTTTESDFSMVIYKASEVKLPCILLHSEKSSSDLSRLHEQAAVDVLRSLHLPPWRCYVTPSGRGVTMHLFAVHALYDARSLQLVLADIALALKGLPSSSQQAFEPVLSKILLASKGETEDIRSFWSRHTKNVAMARFPTMTPLQVYSRCTKVYSKLCSKSLMELQGACRTAGLTIKAAGQVAWSRILSAYTGEPVVTFGVVLSGRSSSESMGVAFPCITTVPFSCRADQSVAAQLDATMKFNASVQRYQFTPLTKIQRWTGAYDRPLFDTVFAYQKVQSDDERPLPWRLIEGAATTEYPVSLELDPLPSGELNLRITFSTHVLPEKQAVLLIDQFDHTLIQTIWCSDQSEGAQRIFNPSLFSHVQPKEDFIPSETSLLHGLVELSAQNRPQQCALQFVTGIQQREVTSRSWTYAELDKEGNRIARILQRHHVPQGSLVGICFEKCPEASFAILGILKAGCAFVAIDPAAPPARKQFIVEDSGAAVVLLNGRNADGFGSEPNTLVIQIDSITEDISTESIVLSRDVQSQDLSYCLYTSGSTGLAKGCELTHENAVQALLAFSRMFGDRWNNESRWLQFASFHFDVSILEQFWSWSVGICVVSGPRDIIFEDIAGFISRLKITHLDLTPSLARLLDPEDVPSLWDGVFITGGEQLSQDVLDMWGRIGAIHNGYGPTETTIGVTMYPRVPANGRPTNIGYQFDNVGTYVLRPGGTQVVPRGGVGELCIYGRLVGRGYRNRSELTRERFPHFERDGVKIYRTGDLVRLLHDGSFDFVGRADDQVKLRGQRIEIGEINNIIKEEVKDVQDIVTLLAKHPKSERDTLVSFIVPISVDKQGKRPDLCTSQQALSTIQAVEDACRARLPNYMVPSHLFPITFVPLSATNKSDKKALKELFNEEIIEKLQKARSSQGRSLIGPSSSERRIIQALATFLKIDEGIISPTSNTFQLGLDSISVVGFVRYLKDHGFVKATISLVMRNAIVSRLAQVLSTQSVEAPHHYDFIINAKQTFAAIRHKYGPLVAEIFGIDQDSIESLAPCTPLQQGIISRSLRADSPLYFGEFYLELSNTVDVSKLYSAWHRVFDKAQILRTRFVSTPDGHVQAALRAPPFPWIECTGANDSEIDAYFKSRFSEWWKSNRDHFERPFELILGTSNSKRVLKVHIAHPLYDGRSLPLLLGKVAAEYANEHEIEYGPKFQDTLAHGPLKHNEEARRFWTTHLASSGSCHMPSLISKPWPQDNSATLVLDISDAFENLRRKLGVTHQVILQACWAITLQKYIGAKVLFGMIVSGRSFDFDGVEHTIGPLFNTVPFCISLAESNSWADVIQACHRFNTSVLEFEHTPLRDISKWIGRNSNDNLFDSLFGFRRELEEDSVFESPIWQHRESDVQADFALSLEVVQTLSGQMKVTIVAQRHISDPETSRMILARFQSMLMRLLEDENASIADVLEVGTSTPKDRLHSVPNGAKEPRSNRIQQENWTRETRIVRTEIASLIEADSDVLDEHSSIFELGLDSIDAIKLSSRLRAHGIIAPVSIIVREQTIHKIMQSISVGEKEFDKNIKGSSLQRRISKLEEHVLVRGISLANVEQILPVTPLQEAMVAEMLRSGFSKYYNQDILELRSDVELPRLQKAWQHVLDKSPVLRTTFITMTEPDIESAFAQVIHKQTTLRWNEVQISRYESLAILAEGIRKNAANAEMQDDLFNITIVHFLERRYLLLTLAHALYDGWSLSLLHEDVNRAYHEVFSERPSYNSILGDILDGSHDEAERFWRNYLSGAKTARFPVRQANGSPEAASPVHRKEILSSTSSRSIKSWCRRHGTNPHILGLTCFAAVIAWHLRQLEVVFGTVISGRDTEEAADVLFPTMNTVLVRSIINGTRKSMLRYMQDNYSKIRPHQFFPLRKAQSIINRQGQSLFDTLFIYQKRRETQSQSRPLYQSVDGNAQVEYPLCVEFEEAEESFIWRIACEDRLLDEEGVDMLLQRLEAVLSNSLQEPHAPAIQYIDGEIALYGLSTYRITEDKDPNVQCGGSYNGTAQSQELWSPTEMTILRTLARVSKYPETSITKDLTLFHMGLDSISAIKVATLLRQQSLHLSVAQILKAATVTKMAEAAEERSSSPSIPSTDVMSHLRASLAKVDVDGLLREAGIKEDTIEEKLPCTPGQVYMLTLWQNSRGEQFYPEFCYQVRGDISLEQIRKSWDALVQKTPILRTIFIATGDANMPFFQAVLRTAQESLHHCDDSLTALSSKTSRQPFMKLFAHLQNGVWLLRLRIHHALYDGVSLPNMMSQLKRLLNHEVVAAPSIDAFKQLLALGGYSEVLQKRRMFWTEYLREVYIAHHQRMVPPCGEERTELVKRNALSIQDVKEFTRRQGLSVQSMLLATYARTHFKLFAHRTDHDNANATIVFGIYLANRSHPIEGLPEVLAPTVNLVPLRVSNPLLSPIEDIAARIQSDLQEISNAQNSTVGLWEIEAWTGLKLDTFINLLELPDKKDEKPADSATQVNGTRKVEIEDFEGAPSGQNGTTNTSIDVDFEPEELRKNPVKHCYLQSLDIEAAIRNDGLDIGVFSPASILNNSGAQQLVEEWRVLLAEVAPSNETRPTRDERG